MAEEKDGAAEAPKKSSKKMLIIIVAAVVLLGGGGGAFFMMKSGSSAAVAAPKKGTVVAITDALTVNLADSHYLKLQFSLQQTTDAKEDVDTSEAVNLAIDEYTGKTVAELSTDKGRTAVKEELLAKIVKAYTVDKKQEVMDIYYTQFVTQ
ncbi:flagellar basal body-associated FliL family protein [Paractinoplanes globisporus]|uniref:Flagellar protein FliL n=1 Tax=Paractinoplanes globisporus TaxID=113565 RepID=A0ABW6WQR1_9ACTN|nr:flagellar basal body-associated FliL family protein [Actinoplanes globisporus]